MFDVFQDRAGEWRWHLKAANGRIMADSGEGYASQTNAERALRAFRARVATAGVRVRPPRPRKVARKRPPTPAPLLSALLDQRLGPLSVGRCARTAVPAHGPSQG